jgi:ABC-type nitrate/sulfonate/bicarbonate transport system permease component
VRLLSEPFAGATLGGHLRDSLARWGAGVGAAILLGVPLGLLMGWNRTVNAAVAPLFEPLRNVPPLAWIPLMIVWFGTSTLSQVAVVFVGAFPPCVLNAYRAIRIVDSVQLAAASTLGAGAWSRAVEVALPAGLPTLFAGLRIAFGNGWMALIGAELVGASTGLGFLIIRGQENLSAAIIVVGMVAIGVTGLLLDLLLAALARRALPWRRPVEAHE